MINTNNIFDLVKLPSIPPRSAEDVENGISNNTIRIPLLGRMHFVQDSQGWWCISGVLAYWLYGTFSIYFVVLQPMYDDDVIPSIVYYGYLGICALCIMALFKASFTNPGRIPIYDPSKHSDKKWVLCPKCNQMRPPRAHHCRRCGQCVMRMDHHCPWINNCVGEDNHFAFLQLLFYAWALGTSAFSLVMCYFWIFPKCETCDTEAFYIKHGIWFMYLCFLLSLNMMIIMGIQFTEQHFNLLINRTTLENMMGLSTANVEIRRCYHSYRELCGQGCFLFWWCPLGRRRRHPDSPEKKNIESV